MLESRRFEAMMTSHSSRRQPNTSQLSVSDIDSSQTAQKFAAFGVTVGSLISEHLLSHPFLVLRRQCQVNSSSRWHHLTPFTILPVWLQLQRQQGVPCIWKGVSSVFMLKGVTLVTETVASELLDLPRDVNRYSSLKRMCQNVLLKALTSLVTTPFYSATLIETVESSVVSDEHSVLGCVRDGVTRLLQSLTPSQSHPGRALIPIYQLVPITVAYSTTHYVIHSCVHYITAPSTRQVSEGTTSSTTDIIYHQLCATLISSLWADVLLYPLETVMNRLHVQGTRTIIDHLDAPGAVEVLAISTRYDGVLDCWRSILRVEGTAGLYKGFGALILQYGLHYMLLCGAKLLVDKVAGYLEDRRRGDDWRETGEGSSNYYQHLTSTPVIHHDRLNQLKDFR